MIYQYEAEILKYINNIIPEIQQCTYSTDEELLNSLSQVKKFPAFFYYRKDTLYEDNRIIPIRDTDGTTTKFSLFTQEYEGTILVVSQSSAFQIASSLRFAMNHTPYVTIKWPNEGSELKVQLTLLYIKVSEERQPDDKKGPCRLVKFGWSSQMFFNTLPEKLHELVEVVRIYLDAEGNGVVVGKNSQGMEVILNNLIKQI